MATTINTAANAYLNTLKQAQTGGAEKPEAGAPSFGDILKTSIGSAIDAQHKSEQVSAASLTGKSSMTDVLQAVNNAEVALNSVLAIRDKVVQAYDTIMRTQI
jgi:flagellar hook-basal body complex protein FliE